MEENKCPTNIKQCDTADSVEEVASVEDDSCSIVSTSIASQIPSVDSLPQIPSVDSSDSLPLLSDETSSVENDSGVDDSCSDACTDQGKVTLRKSLPSCEHGASLTLEESEDCHLENTGKVDENVLKDFSTPVSTHQDEFDSGNDSWTLEKGVQLQVAAEKLFGNGCAKLLNLKFSFAIADPQLEGCPLIGCSSGFSALCGYEMDDVVGLTCRLLVELCPAGQVDPAVICRCQAFLLAAKEGTPYRVPVDELDDWLPKKRPSNELIAIQTNVHQNGSVFNSLLLMTILGLGDFDEEHSYVVVLQSKLPRRKVKSKSVLLSHLKQLDKNMARVEKIFAKEFIVSCPMRRQEPGSDDDDLANIAEVESMLAKEFAQFGFEEGRAQ